MIYILLSKVCGGGELFLSGNVLRVRVCVCVCVCVCGERGEICLVFSAVILSVFL